MDLVVGTEEVEGLTLVTAPGATVSGTIVSDTGEAFDFRTQLRVSGRAATPEVQGMGPGGGSRIGDDWTFTLLNVADPIVIRTSAPQGWMLKSVFLRPGHHRHTDGVPAWTIGERSWVVMTKKIASVSGAVTDARVIRRSTLRWWCFPPTRSYGPISRASSGRRGRIRTGVSGCRAAQPRAISRRGDPGPRGRPGRRSGISGPRSETAPQNRPGRR